MPDTSRAVIRMTVERILDEVFPDETGAARLQQVGLFILIWAFEGDKEPVTAARIAGMTGEAPSRIHRQLRKFMALGVVERTRVLNRQGRGHAWRLSIEDTPQARKLVRAIGTAGKPQR